MQQREMPMIGNIKRDMQIIPQHLIKACENKQEAIQLCIKWSTTPPGVIAKLLDIDKGNFSRMFTGSASFPPNKENNLMDICGNEAILEWSNYSRGKRAIDIDVIDETIRLVDESQQLKQG